MICITFLLPVNGDLENNKVGIVLVVQLERHLGLIHIVRSSVRCE